ncbi:MAG: alpha/beta hydrolase [Candidatus Eutrophobiaceae bacterium]
MSLECIIANPPSGECTAAVIWLHGLGANGNDFASIADELHLPQGHGIRFIFPHAPKRPVTINGGMVMRAWYDVVDKDLRSCEDEQGLADSLGHAHALIGEQIAAGIAVRSIVLAGFSQGGAISLHAGLRYPEQLAGLLVLSSYLPLPDRLAAEGESAQKGTPIFMSHGEFDPVIPLEQGSTSHAQLQTHGYQSEWHSYPMEHSVCRNQMDDIGSWLAKCLLEC